MAASEALLKCGQKAGAWQEASKGSLVRTLRQGQGLFTTGPATDEREPPRGRARSGRKHTQGVPCSGSGSTQHHSAHHDTGQLPEDHRTPSPQGPHQTGSSRQPHGREGGSISSSVGAGVFLPPCPHHSHPGGAGSPHGPGVAPTLDNVLVSRPQPQPHKRALPVRNKDLNMKGNFTQ